MTEWFVALLFPLGFSDPAPILRVQYGGPAGYISSLAVAPDDTLLVGSWDKSVHVYTRPPGANRHQNAEPFRIPVGPGLSGAVNAVAVGLQPPGETWLAVAGRGASRDEAGSAELGLITPAAAKTPSMRRDEGAIRLFSLKDRTSRSLMGHLGPVLDLSFAPSKPILASIADDWDETLRKPIHVVRVWTLGPNITSISIPIAGVTPSVRPQLAWLTDATDPLLALATGEPQAYVINLSTQKVTTLPLGAPVRSCVAIPGKRFFLAVGKELQEWGFDQQQPIRQRQIPLGELGDIQRLALAGKLVVGLAVRDKEQRLFGVDSEDPNAQVQIKPLGLASGDAPALTANDRLVAISVRSSHAVDVFPVVNNQIQPGPIAEPLASPARFPRQVQWARRGERIGLSFRTTQRPDANDNEAESLIFDVTNRQVLSDTNGWTLVNASDATAVRFRVDAEGNSGPRQVVAVTQNNQVREIRLETGERITAYSFRTTRSQARRPILALAIDRRGEPWISLIDLNDGKPIRRLTHHSDRIRSLAFSADGRRLVSSADDRLICVWDLDDLEREPDQHGCLLTWQFQDANGIAVGASMASDGPPLREGDRLMRITFPDGARQPSDVFAFYKEMYLRPAGTPMTMQVMRAGQQVEIPARLDRAVEDRRPLFSLLVSSRNQGESAWIGWSPLGRFDASLTRDDDIGWLFNQWDRPESPTSFAPGSRFKNWHRVGLLAELLEKGSVAAMQIPPRPRPRVLAWLADADGTMVPFGRFVERIRTLDTRIELSSAGFENPQNLVAELRSENSQTHRTLAATETGWSLPIQQLKLTRGIHSLSVTIRDVSSAEQHALKNLLVDFDPPPPVIHTNIEAAGVAVDSETFPFKARFECHSHSNLHVRLSVQSMGKETQLAQQSLAQGTEALEQAIPLSEGENLVRITATEESGLNPQSTNWVGSISFRKPKPPRIVVESVSANGMNIHAHGKEPIIVESSPWTIRGKVYSEKPIRTSAFLATTKPERKLTLKKHLSEHEFSFEIEDTGEVGDSPRRLWVGTDHAQVEVPFTIRFLPSLPSIQWKTPSTRLEQQTDSDSLETRLEFTLSRAIEQGSFVLLDNGHIAPWNHRLQGRELTGTFAAKRGERHIMLQYQDPFGRRVRTEPRTVVTRQLPVIGPIVDQKISSKGELQIRLSIKSALPLEKVLVNGLAVAFERTQTGDIQLNPVTLEPGENNLEINAVNADGKARQSRSLRVNWNPPKPVERPRIAVLSPVEDQSFQEPNTTARIAVVSLEEVQQFRVTLNGQPVAAFLNASKSADVPLLLKPGANELVVAAANVGGETKITRRMVHVPPPYQIVWDRIVNVDGSQTIIPDSSPENQKPTRVREGRIRLHATLRLKTPTSTAPESATVTVNGYRQVAPSLRKTAEGTWTITSNVVLTHPDENRIDLVVLGSDVIRARQTLRLCCDQPETQRRLHLFLVGGNSNTHATRIQQALRLVGGGELTKHGFRPGKMFDTGFLYGPIDGNADVNVLLTQLQRMHLAMRRYPNDLAILCIAAPQHVDREGRMTLGMGVSASSDDDLSSTLMGDILNRTPGGHLVVLESVMSEQNTDLARQSQIRSRDWWSRAMPASYVRWLTNDTGAIDPLLRQLADLLPKHHSLRKPDASLTEQFGIPVSKINWSMYDSHVIPEILDARIAEKRSSR